MFGGANPLVSAMADSDRLIAPQLRKPDHKFHDFRARLAQRQDAAIRRTLSLLLVRSVARRGESGKSLLRSLWRLAPTRELAVEFTLRAARFDDGYLEHARAGDKARDARNWPLAISHYETLLELYPLHPGYWVQISHCRKELKQFRIAEIGYRNALAFGTPVQDVWSHLEHVVRFGGGSLALYPPKLVQQFELAADRKMAVPDLTCSYDVEKLSWLLLDLKTPAQDWLLRILRAAPEQRQLVEHLMLDPGFAAVNRRMIALLGRSGSL